MQNKLQFLKHKHPPQSDYGKKKKLQEIGCGCISIPLQYLNIQSSLFVSDDSILLILRTHQ